MTVFVLGAGATRGCSFVDASKNPCLPPLDRDYFTQLQRVRNPKHKQTIQQVMKDVVDVFGQNFDVTMETVFSTLEHTSRMLKTTGDSRAFKRTDLNEKRERLKQTIGIVLEESLSINQSASGRSSIKPQVCKYHEKMVTDVFEPKDTIISFNYDCTLDYALKSRGSEKWNAHYGYGFKLGARGKGIQGEGFWQPDDPADQNKTIHLYKLHGSLHFDIPEKQPIKLKQRPYTRQNGNPKYTIIPPEWHKAYDKGVFSTLWGEAGKALNKATRIVLIGYSLPPTDLHSTALFRTSIQAKKLKSLVIVNPDKTARKRMRSVLQRGLSIETKVISFDYLSEFVAMDKSVWR